MSTEDDLQAMLDQDDTDHLTRLVLADWLQEMGDERALGMRAMGVQGLGAHPSLYFFIIGRSDNPNYSQWLRQKPHLATSAIPPDWFKLNDCFCDDEKLVSYWWIEVPTRCECESNVALAFLKLPAHRQQELLAGGQMALTGGST